MSGGFGRKGVMAGAPVGRSFGSPISGNPRPATPANGSDDGMSPAARAFIAAERARGERNDFSGQGKVRATAPMSAFDSAALLQPATARPTKSLVIAYVFWWFGGPIGAHRFYLGATKSGLAMLGLLFGAGLMAVFAPIVAALMIVGDLGWTLVDAFLIPGLRRRSVEPADNSRELAQVFS
jgi:TM2 domain-containing membrane protein YozV